MHVFEMKEHFQAPSFKDGEKSLIITNTFNYNGPYSRPIGISAVCDTRYGPDKIITSLHNDYIILFSKFFLYSMICFLYSLFICHAFSRSDYKSIASSYRMTQNNELERKRWWTNWPIRIFQNLQEELRKITKHPPPFPRRVAGPLGRGFSRGTSKILWSLNCDFRQLSR
jgi:hypothetical protein